MKLKRLLVSLFWWILGVLVAYAAFAVVYTTAVDHGKKELLMKQEQVRQTYCKSRYKQGSTWVAYDGTGYVCFDRKSEYPYRIQQYYIVLKEE